MPEKNNIKEIKMETLDRSRRNSAAGNAKKIIFVIVLLLITAGAGTLTYKAVTGPVVAARFTVSKMNCPACITTVKETTGKIPGVTNTDISLAAQEVFVSFKQKQTRPDEIGQAISRAGYPALFDGIFNPKTKDTKNPVVAIVNGKPLFRSDLDQPPGFRAFTGKSPDTGEMFFNSVGKKILLQASDNQNVVVQPSEIELDIKQFRIKNGMPQEALELMAEKYYGSMAKLNQAIAQKIAITKMLQESVPSGIKNQEERKRQILSRTGTIFNQSDVEIYDPDIGLDLNSDTGNSGWQTFWPRMIGRETGLVAMLLD